MSNKKQDENATEVHSPDFSLQQKVGGKGSLGSLFTPERIRQGQQAIENFKSAYFEAISGEIAELHAASVGEVERGLLLDSVKSLKSQCETLGFEFIMKVCHSMYEFMLSKNTYSAGDIIIIQKHAEAILAGIRKKERGRGGMLEEETLANLDLLKRKLADQETPSPANPAT